MSGEEKKKVLIVDDSLVNIELIANYLNHEGYDISFTQKSTSVVEKVLSNNYDLILLDIMMPDMDGYEVCSHIKEKEQIKDIPIIFLTAKDDVDSIIKAFETGGVDYITKPVTSQELIARVRTHVSLKEKSDNEKEINKILEKKVSDRTQELKTLNDKLEMSNSKLKNLDKAKSTFLSLISHEVRTPLHGILSFTELLKDSAEDEDSLDFIDGILESAKRLLTFSDISLLITSLKAETYQMNIDTIDLNNIVSKMIELKKEERSDIEYDLDFNEIEEVPCDYDLLNMAISNVMKNALEHTKNGKKLRVIINSDDDNVILEVINQGEGFDEKILSQGIDAFVDENVDYHHKGLGLGLYTSKIIMDSHGGELFISNDAEGNASVKFIFKKKI